MRLSIDASDRIGTGTYDSSAECVRPYLWNGNGLMAAVVTSVLAAGAPLQMQAQAQAYQVPRVVATTTGRHTLVEYAASTTSLDHSPENLRYRVMSQPEVVEFKRLLPTVDVGAVQGLFDLALKHFGDITRLGTRFDLEKDEEDVPVLHLSLNTYDLDMDDQLERELAMRETIWQDAHLREAKQNIVINVY